MKALLNAQTRLEGYTPLHFAVIGNRKLLTKKLIEIGSDLNMKTHKGQTVMHLAASAGSVYLLTYLHRVVGLELYDRDNTGETPLHIAAGEGMDNSAILLTVWYENKNIRDNEGFTPLHMAAFSKSYRIVRHLIISGAEINVEDVSGKTPLDIATSVNASEDILNLLKKPFFLQRFNPMSATLTPVKSSVARFIIFTILLILRYSVTFVLLLPSKIYTDTNQFYNIFSIIFLFFSTFTFLYVIFKDPGYVEKSPDIPLIELYEKYNSEYVCPYCEVRKSKDVKHCQHCNRCVKKFDHHCPWIHNCVGQK
jgi:ankyrin repeat protein